jgi:hypothetical protein
VIRAADNPVPPGNQARPANPAPGQRADEGDASYWYDLSGADRSPVPAETRGPFEPLVSSSGTHGGNDGEQDVDQMASVIAEPPRVW